MQSKFDVLLQKYDCINKELKSSANSNNILWEKCQSYELNLEHLYEALALQRIRFEDLNVNFVIKTNLLDQLEKARHSLESKQFDELEMLKLTFVPSIVLPDSTVSNVYEDYFASLKSRINELESLVLALEKDKVCLESYY